MMHHPGGGDGDDGDYDWLEVKCTANHRLVGFMIAISSVPFLLRVLLDLLTRVKTQQFSDFVEGASPMTATTTTKPCLALVDESDVI